VCTECASQRMKMFTFNAYVDQRSTNRKARPRYSDRINCQHIVMTVTRYRVAHCAVMNSVKQLIG
jgi:hypothetical protein